LMDRLGLKEGEVIQHSMVTASIERAQKKVEENNFGIRKRLLEYDDVMNSQRTVIYKRRRNALFGERLKLDILNMFNEVATTTVQQYHGDPDNDAFTGFEMDLFRKFTIASPVTAEEFRSSKEGVLADTIYETAMDAYERHGARLAAQAMPVVTDVFLNQGKQYENIVVPITDGMKTMQVVTNLEKCYKTQGHDLITSIEKYITLAIIDNEWKEHLREMDELRRSVQNASIEQKDPLLIYKLESFKLFKAMIERINGEVVGFLAKAGLPAAQPEVQQAPAPREPQQRLQTGRDEVGAPAKAAARQAAPVGSGPARGPMPPQGPRPPMEPVRVEKKVGRNDPCPCGSGKKFKQCHGKDA